MDVWLHLQGLLCVADSWDGCKWGEYHDSEALIFAITLLGHRVWALRDGGRGIRTWVNQDDSKERISRHQISILLIHLRYDAWGLACR